MIIGDDLYLKSLDGEDFRIDSDLIQLFYRRTKLSEVQKEYTLVNQFLSKNDNIQCVELEILKLLKDFGFATERQMCDILGLKGIEMEVLDNVISDCLRDKIINKFTLIQKGYQAMFNGMPEDGFCVYCLDYGAKYILNHYTNTDDLIWTSSDNVAIGHKVYKKLMVLEFYIQMCCSLGVERIDKFYSYRDFTVRYDDKTTVFAMPASFTSINEKNGDGISYLLDFVKGEDIYNNWPKRLEHKLGPFFTRYWRLYYNALPMFFVIVEDENIAREVVSSFFRMTENDRIRAVLASDIFGDRDNFGLSSLRVYAYDKNSGDIKKKRTKAFQINVE